MPIDRHAPFQHFDPDFPDKALDIPDDLEVTFGNHRIVFKPGAKNEKRQARPGDYTIHVNDKQLKDLALWQELTHERYTTEITRLFLMALFAIQEIHIEQQAHDAIRDLHSIAPNLYEKLMQQNHGALDRMSVVLYYCWHRCQIEDRAYPPNRPDRKFSGRRDFLGALYLFTALHHPFPLVTVPPIPAQDLKTPTTFHAFASRKGDSIAFRTKRDAAKDYDRFLKAHRGSAL